MDGDGCNNDCTFSCEVDADCDDADMCTGTESCSVMHVCSSTSPLDCDDADACTLDMCEPSFGCRYQLMDGDGDGHSPLAGMAGCVGDDCDDGDPNVFPGAPEFCDMDDNDCDGMVDEMARMATCYPDRDADGYPVMSGAMMACICPAGYTTLRADRQLDCADGISAMSIHASVNPGQTMYFTAGYCPPRTTCTRLNTTWDYNCDGTEEQRYPRASTGLCTAISIPGGTTVCRGEGWVDGSVPACGDAAEAYRTCTLLRGVCRGATADRQQECR
jgi:hypothetical protein